jgi:hypothetical protein
MEAGMLWRGFNKETGEAVYQDTKARTIAHIFDEVKLKSLCRTLLPMGDNSSSKEKD